MTAASRGKRDAVFLTHVVLIGEELLYWGKTELSVWYTCAVS
ncbi:protein of unknown function [Burkholderia multivorans]